MSPENLPPPIILQTERLNLRLANPNIDEDCRNVIRFYNDGTASRGGNARVGINTIEDVRKKHRIQGADSRPELCTLQPPPYGDFFLTLLPPTPEQVAAGEKMDYPEGNMIGGISMSFRAEMPYPDIGYGTFGPWEGKGYASEAGRRALKYWREEIGVKDVFCGALNYNARSLRCAERIGFIKAGTFQVDFGTGDDLTRVSAIAYVLPGMKWEEHDKDGGPIVIRPTVGTESDAQKKDDLSASSRDLTDGR